jgi:hypothetical protein
VPTSASFEAEAIRQLGQQLSEAEQRLQFAELKIQVLEERLREALIKKYGPAARSYRALNWSYWNWSLE